MSRIDGREPTNRRPQRIALPPPDLRSAVESAVKARIERTVAELVVCERCRCSRPLRTMPICAECKRTWHGHKGKQPGLSLAAFIEHYPYRGPHVSDELLVPYMLELVIRTRDASVDFLRRTFHVSTRRVRDVLQRFADAGVVGPLVSGHTTKVLVPRDWVPPKDSPLRMPTMPEVPMEAAGALMQEPEAVPAVLQSLQMQTLEAVLDAHRIRLAEAEVRVPASELEATTTSLVIERRELVTRILEIDGVLSESEEDLVDRRALVDIIHTIEATLEKRRRGGDERA